MDKPSDVHILKARLNAFRYVLDEERCAWTSLISQESDSLRSEILSELQHITHFDIDCLSPSQVRLLLPESSIKLKQYIIALEQYKDDATRTKLDLDSTTSKLTHALSELDSYRTKHSLLRNHTVALQRQVDKHRVDELQYEKKLKELSSNTLKMVAGYPRQRIQELETQLEECKMNNVQLERDFEQVKKLLIDEQERNVDVINERDGCLVSNGHLNEQILKFKELSEAAENRVHEIYNINLKLIDDASRAQSDLQSKSTDLDSANSEINKLLMELEEGRNKVSETSALIESLSSTNEELSSENESYFTKVQDLEAELLKFVTVEAENEDLLKKVQK
ncbi:hypothetical protein GEMRC1_010640 [Eukaryota sp. GEM-RC1]